MNVPLTPLRFLLRAERQFGSHSGVIDGDRHWSYRDYARRCRQLANLLRSLGVGGGARVAFLGDNTHQLLEAYYGVLLAGATLLPLNTRLAAADFRYILEDSGASCLLLEERFSPVIAEIRRDLPSLKGCIQLRGKPVFSWLEQENADRLVEAQSDALDFDVMQVDEDSVAEVFYTSGTTGHPKGVMLSHRNLYLHALETIISSHLRPTDIHLHSIALFHVNGWGTPQSLTALGATHVMLPRFEADAVLEAIAQHRVTTMYLVPTMAISLLQSPLAGTTDVSSLRQITLGGAAANRHLLADMEEAFSCDCVSGYGLTETTPVVTHASLKHFLKLEDADRLALQSTAGWELVGTELELRDTDGNVLPWDGKTVGEVTIRGDGVMSGYWNKPEETREQLRHGWFHTGDMGTVSPQGYLTIVDRSKDVIISGGENIASLEVERVLCSHPAVLEAAVVAAPDSKWGEIPVALIVLRPNRAVSEQELSEHCRERLAHFKVPQRIEFLDSFPRGGTGKVLKRELRERFWKGKAKRVN